MDGKLLKQKLKLGVDISPSAWFYSSPYHLTPYNNPSKKKKSPKTKEEKILLSQLKKNQFI